MGKPQTQITMTKHSLHIDPGCPKGRACGEPGFRDFFFLCGLSVEAGTPAMVQEIGPFQQLDASTTVFPGEVPRRDGGGLHIDNYIRQTKRAESHDPAPAL